MRAVIQRVKRASVEVENKPVGKIQEGLCIFLGVQHEDTIEDIEWLCKKMVNLRIFNDEKGAMNLSLKDLRKEVLLISQFTLYANVKKGNRPSFVKSARPEIAEPLYQKVQERLEYEMERKIKVGVFGANMQIDLCNDGPVTIIIDTKNRTL